MSVEKADTDDQVYILSVINKSNKDAYRSLIPHGFFRDPVLTVDDISKEFKRMVFYVYKLDDEVLGVAALRTEKDEVGIIRWVHVLPEHRRKGIGTTLIRHIEVEAAKMGLKRLTVSCVFDEAGWAKSFYVKLGYKVGDMIALPWGGSAHLYEKALV